MVRILGLLFLFSFSARAAVLPGGVPQVGAGASTAADDSSLRLSPSDLPNMRTLSGGNVTTTASNYYFLKNQGNMTADGENYQVPAGKTLYCTSMSFNNSASCDFTLGYGSAAPAADGTATNPAGRKLFGLQRMTSSSAQIKWSYFMSFPASSFPFIRIETGSIYCVVNLSCIERTN